MHRLLVGLVPLAFVLFFSGSARADLASVSVRGQAGVDGSDGYGLDASEPHYGTALGLRAAAQVLFLEGYWDRVSFGEGRAVTRTVLGVRSDFDVVGLELIFRAGLGAMSESGGALADMPLTMSRNGAVARAGAAVEAPLGMGFRAGLGIDTEAYVLKPSGEGFGDDNADGGGSVFASLYLAWQLGL